MSAVIDEKIVFKSFNFFFKKATSTTYNYPYTERSKRLCLKFIELLSSYNRLSSLGEDFLTTYMTFQFNYWKDLTLVQHNKRIDISYIIGVKAFKRFVNRNQQFDWVIEKESRTYDKKALKKTLNLTKHSISESTQYDPDELYRRQHFNEEIGLSNCITFTSLYNPASPSCSQCRFKEECILTLKNIYPNIYINRIIDGTANTTKQQ